MASYLHLYFILLYNTQLTKQAFPNPLFYQKRQGMPAKQTSRFISYLQLPHCFPLMVLVFVILSYYQ